METALNTDTARAWVGCLGCYNSGALVGKWLEGELIADPVAAGLATLETVGDYTAARCVRCFSDEFMVLDHEGLLGLVSGECSLNEAAAAAATVAEIEGEGIDLDAAAAFISDRHAWDLDEFHESYYGEFDTLEDFAQQFALDTGAIDQTANWPHSCIDWQHAARELSYDFALIGRYVFRQN